MKSEAVVGRERELESVRAFLDRGAGALVLEGEAGIGKTTVWLEGAEAARERGYRVLVARPADVETALPFAALTDLLEPALDDARRWMPEPQRRALEVALARREPESAFDERVVAAAALTALRTLAEDGPVLLAVDDLQWVDPPSANVLAYALRRLGDDRVQLLSTRRTGCEGGLALREEALVAVGPLGPDEIGRIVRTRLGLELRRPAVLRIAARAGGNPFYALELARDGRLVDDPDAPLPSSLGAALRKRLAATLPPTRDALAFGCRAPGPDPGAARARRSDACRTRTRDRARPPRARRRAPAVLASADRIRSARHPDAGAPARDSPASRVPCWSGRRVRSCFASRGSSSG